MNKVWILITPDGDTVAFNSELTAHKYVNNRLKECDRVKEDYLSYCDFFKYNCPERVPCTFDKFVDTVDGDNYDYNPYCVTILDENNI